MKKLLLVVMVLLMVLYVTNPSKTNFRDYIEDEMDDMIANSIDTSSSHVDKLLLSLGSFLADGTAEIADNLYEREDYLIFSVYTMTLFDEEYKYLGIFRQFIDMTE